MGSVIIMEKEIKRIEKRIEKLEKETPKTIRDIKTARELVNVIWLFEDEAYLRGLKWKKK